MPNNNYANDYIPNINGTKRLLITCVIDISPSTAIPGDFGNTTANALINKNLRSFINQLAANPKILASAEICFITYSTNITVGKFEPLRKIKENIPQFDAVRTGGTFTASALEKAYEITQDRARIIIESGVGSGLYTSAVILLTDGHISQHDTEEKIAKVTEIMNTACLEKIRTKKVLPFIVGVGSHLDDNTKKILAGFSKGFLDGFFYLPGKTGTEETDFAKLFGALSSSLIATVNIADKNTGDDNLPPGQTVDVLLNQLRDLVCEEYRGMIYTVND